MKSLWFKNPDGIYSSNADMEHVNSIAEVAEMIV